jgi:starch-binding outer membrane protein, SusD/RagB family
MNNLKKIFTLLLAGLVVTSCDDLLDTPPTDRISTEIFWKTEKDATLGANAVYTHLIHRDPNNPNTLITGSHYASWDGMTDIGYTNLPQSPESFILQGTFDQLNSRIGAEWTNLYAGIRSANSFMNNVDGVQTTNTALIDRLKGEVRVLRAYFYSQLALLFGDVPLITSELTLEESRHVSRTPVNEIWDFVSAELTQAADLLPPTQTEKGRVTKGTALALKSRYMLYAGRYQEAADAASAVMALGVYSILPVYKNVFITENNTEIILDIQYVKGTLPNDIFGVLAQRSVGGRNLFVPTKKLVDAYEMTNGLAIDAPGSGYNPATPYAGRDPRLGYSIFVEGDVLPNGNVFNPKPNSTTGDAVGSSFLVSPTGFNVEKYVQAADLATPNNTGVNLILMRYAEVQLIYAEAKVELNQIDQSVYDAINRVRRRPDVNMPAITTGKTQDELREIVRHERLVELAFEGQRYHDIRRWKIAGSVMPGKVYGLTYRDPAGNLQTAEVTSWINTWAERNYLWPIPQIEVDQNPGLGQNPEW